MEEALIVSLYQVSGGRIGWVKALLGGKCSSKICSTHVECRASQGDTF